MSQQLPTLQLLLRELQKIPYLASKNLYKVAFYLLAADFNSVEQLCFAIQEARKKISPCKQCFYWAENATLCNFCLSKKRNTNMICVVETWQDLLAVERTHEYNGIYHVLGGVLCPLEGVGIEDLHIQALLNRLATEQVEEIIFATNPTPEGEATASYIASKITNTNITISKFASGIPVGSNLEFMDRVTISKSLLGRKPF